METEAGNCAVFYTGMILLSRAVIERMGRTKSETNHVKINPLQIATQVEKFRGNGPFANISDRTCVVVDDRLAPGLTMIAAILVMRIAGEGG